MGKAEVCPPGSEITTPDECKNAMTFATSLGINLRPSKQLVISERYHVPFQCSVQLGGDQIMIFKPKETSNTENIVGGSYRMICKKGTK